MKDTDRIITPVQDAGIRIGNSQAGNPHWAGVEFIALDGDSDDLAGAELYISGLVVATLPMSMRLERLAGLL